MANNSPSLWTHISFSFRPLLIQEMITRSKTAGLKLVANLSVTRSSVGSPGFDLLRSVLRSDLTRIQQLNLVGTTSRNLEALFNEIPRISAPRLHTLGFKSFMYDQHIGAGFQDPLSLAESCLGETRSLRYVELPHAPSWNSRLLINLTHLKVYDRGIALTAEMLEAFQRMPALQVLHLVNLASNPMEESSSTSDLFQVDLPHLQEINLCDTVSNVENILRHILFLPSTQMILICNGTPTSGSDFSGIISAVEDLLSAPAASHSTTPVHGLQSLEITASPGSRHSALTFKGWSDIPDSLRGHCPSTPPSITLSLTWVERGILDGIATNIGRVSLAVCHALPCRNLAFLHLTDSPTRLSRVELGYMAMLKAFETLPTLRSVCITGFFLDPFLEALTTKSQARSSHPKTSFPALRALWIEQGDFTEYETDTNPLKILQDALRERSLEVLGLDSVIRIRDDDVEQLRDTVGEVIWDEEELGFSDSEEEGEDYCRECGQVH